MARFSNPVGLWIGRERGGKCRREGERGWKEKKGCIVLVFFRSGCSSGFGGDGWWFGKKDEGSPLSKLSLFIFKRKEFVERGKNKKKKRRRN